MLRSFVKLPRKVYRGNHLWVPPFIRNELLRFSPKKNPFFDHSEVQLFLATGDRRPVGRIAAFVNRNHNQFHKDRTGFFGFFECVPDFSTARQLFDAAGHWLKERGMNCMRGPMNFSTNEVCGFLLEGFDKPPATMMPYTPRYYLDFAERHGFRKSRDLYAYLITEESLDIGKYERLARLIKERENLTLRTIDTKKWGQETRKIREMYNASWSGNWGFVPMTEAEFDHLVRQLRPIVDPRLVLMVEIKGILSGFALSIPDISPALQRANGRLFPFGLFRFSLALRKSKQARVVLLAVRPEFQKRGLAGLLIAETTHALMKAGYTAAEMSWTLEENVLIKKPIERIGGRRYKQYRIYEIPL
ncbi:N-acetyltransferase [bacterium]|nr:N-acetyltransferase [bacterium]